MLKLVGTTLLFGIALPAWTWQQPSTKPVFTGAWQLDTAKSKTQTKDDLVWKIHQDSDSGSFAIEELTGGKSLCSAKCVIGKPCEYQDNGHKMSAMTYFLDSTLIQMRSADDNSSVVKRQMKLNQDGTLQVDLITMVPSEKTEVLIFNKQKVDTASGK